MTARSSAARCMSVLALVLMAGACKPAESPPPAAANEVHAEAEARADLPQEQRSPDLFGAWIVESVAAPDPAPQHQGWDAVLLAGVRQLEVLSQCVTVGPFDYAQTLGESIAVRRPPVGPRSEAAPAPAPVQCARTLSPAERALGPLLLEASEVRRREDGSVSVSGPSGTLTMRRPSGALANPRGDVPPPSMPPLLGAWRFASIDGRSLAPNQRMELLLRPRHLEWRSGCVAEVREVRVEGAKLIPGPIETFPSCERGRSEAEVAAARLFAGAVAARMGTDGRLRLQGSGVTAELEPLTR